MSVPRYRIAPSPTGFFHVGGARTALFNWALARREGGTFVLRIEDTDEARDRPEWTQGIIDALAWLGIGADDPTFEGPYFQSANADAHVAAAERLYDAGLAYYCDLTGDEIQARSKESGKPGYGGWSRDRALGPGPGRALRFRVPEGTTVVRDLIRGDVTFDHDAIEDFVLLRGNGRPIFVLANVVDDISMGITHVVRGEEHLPNTPKQQLLWQALGHEPPVWAHVPVLVNESRKKLSKRRDKVALEQYRDEGFVAAAMVNYLMTLGWAPKGDTEIVPWAHVEAEFRLEDVTHSPAFFDIKKLTAFDKEYIKAMDVDEFVAACTPWIPEHVDLSTFRTMAPLLQTRVATLAEAADMVDFLFVDDPTVDEDAWPKAMGADWAPKLLDEVIASFDSVEWAGPVLKDDVERIGGDLGVKPGKAQAPVRMAVTGRSVGPPLYESLEVLGRDETLRRLRAARERIGV
ncbi:MAG: glutamate--tRNA ligase [Ilumatobacteraceae bacterium]